MLREHGFVEVRRRGSHIVMRCQAGRESRTVAVPHHDELAAGTLLSIIRQSGLPRALFEVKD
jgi:predicted RNA binding protein YcfA (HicA-like mRNA interferase family)